MARVPHSSSEHSPSYAPSSARGDVDDCLAGFVTAVNDEVDAIRTTDRVPAIPVSDGRLVRSTAGQHRYRFRVDDELRAPPDTPIQIRLPNASVAEEIDGLLVQVESGFVIVQTERNLGKLIPQASLVTRLDYIWRMVGQRLTEIIENKRGFDLLQQVLAADVVSRSIQRHIELSYEPTPNDQQAQAVESALSSDVRFIWGPPGTGKSQIIAWLAAETAIVLGEDLLLVSHTNVAVDSALERIRSLPAMQQLIEEGQILRLGVTQNPKIQDLIPFSPD